MFKTTMRLLSLCLVTGLLSASCGKSNGLAPGFSDVTYGGAGSAYEVLLRADGSFTVKHFNAVGDASPTFTVSGTYSRLSTGFLKLTVTGVSGTGGPTAGDTAYGLEVPGFAFLLKPMGAEAEMIPMVALGSCPAGDFTANWISVDKNGADVSGSTDTFGTFQYTAATGTALLPVAKGLASYATISTNVALGSATCSGGIMSISGATMWLTSSGGAVVQTSGGAVIGIPQQTVAISSLAGSYSGLVFNEAGSSGSKAFPVAMTFDAAGAGTGTKLENIETGATASGTVTFALSSANTDAAGFVRATVSAGGTSRNAICAAAVSVAGSSKTALFCTGLSPGDATKIFSLLLVSR